MRVGIAPGVPFGYHGGMIPTKFEYKSQEVTLHCLHAKEFPPPIIFQSLGEEALINGESPTKHVHLRYTQGEFKTSEQMASYGKFQVWERDCGLLVMKSPCLSCKHARVQEPNPGNPAQTLLMPWVNVKAKMR